MELESEDIQRQILLNDSARWPATPTHPCTALIQTGLSPQLFGCRLTWIYTKCIFGRPKLISENRLCEIISIMSEVQRERILNAWVQTWQLWRVQLTFRERWAPNPRPLNLSITMESSVHLNSRNCMHVIMILLPAVRRHRTMHPYPCCVMLSIPTCIVSQHCSSETHNEYVI